jgi:hypothetical protein
MDNEMTNRRPQAYSYWHRLDSIKRFFGNDRERARRLGLVDIDAIFWVEYNDGTRQPAALIETAQDVLANRNKSGNVLCNLANRAGLPAFIVLYTLANCENAAFPCVRDIASFRVRQLNPNPESAYEEMTPAEYALFLESLRAERSIWE